MADSEHVFLARKGAYAIARWRERQPWKRRQLDLLGAYLSGARLVSADLSHDNLSQTDLTNSDLRLADLSGAKLHAAHLWRSNLASANLTDANLAGASLGRANLSGSCLRGADLRGANLSFANLCRASLKGAKLAGADLTEANLAWSDLSGADLRGCKMTATILDVADLTGADLRGAALVRASLDGALFAGIVLEMTLFGDCDLSRVIALDTARHAGPSIIGLDTLFRSKGLVPPQFLRQAGVAEVLVSVQAQLSQVQDACPRVLLVSSIKDEELAGRIQADLRVSGILCWRLCADDEEALRADEGAPHRALFYDCLLLLCSSYALESPLACRFYSQIAQSNGAGRRRILPLAADELLYNRQDQLCGTLRKECLIDFRGWEQPEAYGRGLAELAGTLAESAVGG